VTAQRPDRKRPRATRSRTPRGRSPRRSTCRDHLLDRLGLDRDPRARERPKPPIVAITPNIGTGRKLSVVWGVHCVVAEDARDQDDMVSRAGSIAFRDGLCVRASACWSSRACRSARPAPPTWCASPLSGPTATRMCDLGGHSGARRKTRARNLEIPRCAIAHLRFTLRVPRNDAQLCSAASSEILVFSSFETGQPALAMPASS